MAAPQQARLRKTQERLTWLAELMNEKRVEESVFLGTRHHSVIERSDRAPLPYRSLKAVPLTALHGTRSLSRT